MGGRPVEKLSFVSDSELVCDTLPCDPGPVAIQIQNIAEDGSAIAGEAVTDTRSLIAERVDLTKRADLTRVANTLVKELQRQVIANVMLTTSVDWDGGEQIELAELNIASLPAICVMGPALDENRMYATLRPVLKEPDGRYSRRRTFDAYDLRFRVLVLDQFEQRLLNLLALIVQFFKSNHTLRVARSDGAADEVAYEMEGSDFQGTSTNNKSDLRVCSGTALIRGFQFEDVAGFPEQLIAERTQQVDNVRVTLGQLLAPAG